MAGKTGHRRRRTAHPLKTAALIASLPLSAGVMAVVVPEGKGTWLAWFSLLPLFFAIRSFLPRRAALAAAAWGACVYLFCAADPHTGMSRGIGPLTVLVLVPAVYAYLCGRVTRWTGFNPLVLGVGWMIVELALAPLGLRSGLLGAVQAENPLLHRVADGFGYVLVAFIVALVNASVVWAASGVRLSIPRRIYLLQPESPGRCPRAPLLGFVEQLYSTECQPRAPPANP